MKIEDYKFGKEPVFAPSLILDGALPVAETKLSDVFEFGGTQGSLGIKIEAKGEVTIPEAATLVVSILSTDDKAFANPVEEVLGTITGEVGGSVFADQSIMFEKIPKIQTGVFCKLKLVSSADLSAMSARIYPFYIPR